MSLKFAVRLSLIYLNILILIFRGPVLYNGIFDASGPASISINYRV